ncbi:hypothetical protein NEOLEDRAFT_733061 [Neolentinus lepideus HHB14362 ss-1]|uniref:Mitochondrial import inner membrane translocase subunit n=1 Tax=Neolentinus lepideus HHB14362 ss-1 TaxID=1314782 RepID=A0A165PYE8_9AGAM|nr:hypothetical protein NEOLEDRAFT_733061 [Neolentinus lepideus HHB14362 ss-1]
MSQMSQFDEKTKKEMQTFLTGLQATSQLQQNIVDYTNRCWDKCITGAPGSYLSSSEERCVANCVERFLDASVYMVNKLGQDKLNRDLSQ